MKLKASKLYLLNAPADCLPLFDNQEVVIKLPAKGEIEQIAAFVGDRKGLDNVAAKVVSKLADDALFWIAYPKKTGKIQTDITRDNGWDAIFALGYDPVMQIAVNEDWSALRFRKSEKIGPKLRDIPMSERKTEGIDYVKKTVKLPINAEAALNKHKGLHEYFYAMAFSHKKEYAEAIADAKKEETRLRRIDKMVEMVLKLKTEKEQKKK